LEWCVIVLSPSTPSTKTIFAGLTRCARIVLTGTTMNSCTYCSPALRKSRVKLLPWKTVRNLSCFQFSSVTTTLYALPGPWFHTCSVMLNGLPE